MICHPAWAFLNGYIFRGGFLDGSAGFSIAVHTSHGVFQKYNKLYHLQRAKRKVVPMTSAPVAAGTKITLGER
jgi:hypothetical protein